MAETASRSEPCVGLTARNLRRETRLVRLCKARRDAASADDHGEERLELIGFFRGLVPADAVNPREAHGHPGFMARRAMHRIEGDLEDELGLDLADRAEALHGVGEDPTVKLPQLRVGEAEIGLANRHEFRLAILPCAPSAEGVVRII